MTGRMTFQVPGKMSGIYPLDQIVYANPPMAEVPVSTLPSISQKAIVGVGSIIIGDVRVADDVYIGFHNIVRADSSSPYYIGPKTSLQDFVHMHCHPGLHVEVDGTPMGVYLEGEVSVLHLAAVHGPLFVGHNTFIGQQASLYMAWIGRDCVIMHGAVITGNVKIGDNRYVAPGQAVYTQAQADALPEVPPEYRGLNASVVDHYYRLGQSYRTHTPLVF